MAVSVTEDVIHGTRASNGPDGKTYRRILKIQGLPRTPASDIHDRAMTEASRPPHNLTYARAHPVIKGLFCNAIDTEPVQNSKTDIYVVGGYIDTNVIRIRINGNVTREMTRFDKDGKILFTSYKPGIAARVDPESGDGVYQQPVEVPILRPGLTLEYEWWSTKDNISINPRSVTGYVNLRLWNSGPPTTWLCTDFSQDYERVSGRDFLKRNHAAFLYKGFSPPGGGVRDTHNVMLAYRNPQTRQIPKEIDPLKGGYPNLKSGNGWKEGAISPQLDFARLKLPNDVVG